MYNLKGSLNKIVRCFSSFLLLAVFGAGSIVAQKNIHWGIKGTPGSYWATSMTTGTVDNGNKFTMGCGGILELGLSNHFSIVTGIDLVSTAVKYQTYTIDYSSINTTSESVIRYLQVPLFYKMKTEPLGRIKFFGQFGFGTGFAVSAKNSSSSVVNFRSPGHTFTGVNNDSDTKTTNLFLFRESLLLGIGFEFKISGNTSLIFGLNYDNGLTPVLRDTDASGTNNPKLKSCGIGATAGILF